MKFTNFLWGRPVRGFVVLLLIILFGTVGYKLIEGWSFLDCLYMTVTTLSTVGYSEVHPLSQEGRIFSIFFILGGVGALFYTLTDLVQYVLEGELGIRIGRRQMETKIQRLKNHFIICGYGRVGEAIANILEQEEMDFIVIDKKEENINLARKSGYLIIAGDATDDEVLKQAQIEYARTLIVALGDDVDNTYTTLTARGLNRNLPIIARANNEAAKKKLLIAGASHIVAPETIGGQRMARLALKPKATEFVDSVLFSTKQETAIEEVEVKNHKDLAGYTVHQLEERFPNIRVLALKKDDGTTVYNPGANITFQGMQSILAFGPQEQLMAVEQWFES
jgi:voltage-gated potassium channel